jgi:hypothetical protein
MDGVHVPRAPTAGVLYGVVRSHLTAFVAAIEARTDGIGLPPFVLAEFQKFLRCGVLAHGFARVRCGDCAFERLLPFSCKGRRVSAAEPGESLHLLKYDHPERGSRVVRVTVNIELTRAWMREQLRITQESTGRIVRAHEDLPLNLGAIP